MTYEDAQKLAAAIINAGGSAAVYNGYSGRGMYGASTTGVTTKSDGARYAADLGLPRLRVDSLGKGFIYY